MVHGRSPISWAASLCAVAKSTDRTRSGPELRPIAAASPRSRSGTLSISAWRLRSRLRNRDSARSRRFARESGGEGGWVFDRKSGGEGKRGGLGGGRIIKKKKNKEEKLVSKLIVKMVVRKRELKLVFFSG